MAYLAFFTNQIDTIQQLINVTRVFNDRNVQERHSLLQ